MVRETTEQKENTQNVIKSLQDIHLKEDSYPHYLKNSKKQIPKE
jgi:hypothetical protein